MNKMIFPFIAILFFSKMLVAQVDTVPPVLVCKQNLSLPLGVTGLVTAWGLDFLDTFYDNTNTALELGIRKVCTGSGFPANQDNITFGGNEMGFQKVEVWIRDTAGNTTFCLVNVQVTDYDGVVHPHKFITLLRPDTQGINKAVLTIKGSHCLYDPIDYQIYVYTNGWTIPGQWSDYGFFYSASGYNSTATPSKNINPLNGVSTYDLVLIQKHILGIELLDSPWKIIAADANQDGKVTTFDIITLRKLILGITAELPNGKSWRFAPKDYVFPNPLNPFQPPFPERIEVPNTADPAPHHFQFTGVKIGDVDFSADPNQ